MKNPKKDYGKAFLVAFLMSLSLLIVPAYAGILIIITSVLSAMFGGLSPVLFLTFCLIGFQTPPQQIQPFFFFSAALTFSLGMLYVAAEKKTAT